jgi:signal transduction histidine kinase
VFKQQHTRLFTELIDTHEEFFYLPDGKTIRVFAIPHALGGLLFAYEDVTDRLALERSYNTLIAVQRETLDNLQEGVIVIGENGRVKLSNPTYTRLWKIDESATHHEPHIREIWELCRDLYAVDDWEGYKSGMLGEIQQRRMHQGELERTDGVVLNWRAVPLPDGATLLTYTDITDSVLLERSLRQTNEALEEADRLKTDFLANMSYELRSPLTSIMGFSDILSQAYFGELTEKQREYIDGIQKSSQQLSYLINNILDLASIGAGYMQLDLSDVDIPALLERVLQLVQERLKLMDIEVKIHCEAGIGTMLADESRLKQILFNLLNNAVKYSQPASEIRLIAESDGPDVVLLKVRDFGVGIAPEKQQHIFDRFFRAGATSGQQSGSGLGLTIVKSFVELHGGEVSVESAPGEGATFTCRMPRRTQQ